MHGYIDMTGIRYGNLVAIRPCTSGENVKWLCQCDCGNRVTVRGAHLRFKRIQSCGCMKYLGIGRDLVGKSFGDLTVTDRIPRSGHQERYWMCACKCGKTRKVSSSSLIHKRVVDCGCGRRLALKYNNVPSPEFKKRFGSIIRSHRKSKGFSMAGLSRRVGVTRPIISQYENGKFLPSCLTIVRLIKRLDIPVEEIIGCLQNEPFL
jgi:DNA-binding XRE family transcriptional regulator